MRDDFFGDGAGICGGLLLLLLLPKLLLRGGAVGHFCVMSISRTHPPSAEPSFLQVGSIRVVLSDDTTTGQDALCVELPEPWNEFGQLQQLVEMGRSQFTETISF
jgi:hypothetical protein